MRSLAASRSPKAAMSQASRRRSQPLGAWNRLMRIPNRRGAGAHRRLGRAVLDLARGRRSQEQPGRRDGRCGASRGGLRGLDRAPRRLRQGGGRDQASGRDQGEAHRRLRIDECYRGERGPLTLRRARRGLSCSGSRPYRHAAEHPGRWWLLTGPASLQGLNGLLARRKSTQNVMGAYSDQDEVVWSESFHDDAVAFGIFVHPGRVKR